MFFLTLCAFLFTCLLYTMGRILIYIPGNIAVLELDRKFVSYQNLKCLVSDLCLISKCYFSARASAIFMFTNYVLNIEFIKKYHNI